MSAMREFWDSRAREDPFFFVDNRQRYGHPDQDAFWAQGERDLDRLLSAVGASLQPDDDVVEIGCGIGRLTRVLAQRARAVRALDVSPQMLGLAREHVPADNVQWLLGDGVSITGVPDGSASACVSHVVFQHIPDPAITLGYVAEMGSVLRPGGWAAFQVSNDSRPHRARHAAQRAALGLRGALGRGPRGQTHPAWLGSAVELDALRRTADEAGLGTERVVGEGTMMCCVLLRAPA